MDWVDDKVYLFVMPVPYLLRILIDIRVPDTFVDYLLGILICMNVPSELST